MALEDPGSSGFHLPRDERARTELFVNVVTSYVESGKNRQLKIMVIGEAGQGKSTLINALVGAEVAKEGDQFKAGTLEIQKYNINQNGVDIAIWDTPGFGLGTAEEDEKMVEQLKLSGCDDVDLALFCVRMDAMRFPTRVHTETIVKLNQVFGRKFWRYCLFILTFANNVKEFCPVDEDMVEFFSQRCIALEDQIKIAVSERVKLSEKELELVRAVPVGSYKKGLYRENPWALPDREDWFIMFWLECTEHMRTTSLSALLRANCHRLEAGDAASDSKCPPPHFDAHERLLQATKDEISEANKVQMSYQKETAASTNGRAISPQRHPPDDVVINIDSNASSPQTRQRLTGRHKAPETSVPVADVSSSYRGRNDDDLEKGTHDRKVPLYETLLKQLEDEDSGFFDYVATFSKARGKEMPVIGHLAGLVEGLKAYLTTNVKKKKK